MVYGIVDADKLAENDEIYIKNITVLYVMLMETCSVDKSLPEYNSHGHKEDTIFLYVLKPVQDVQMKKMQICRREEGINLGKSTKDGR